MLLVKSDKTDEKIHNEEIEGSMHSVKAPLSQAAVSTHAIKHKIQCSVTAVDEE